MKTYGHAKQFAQEALTGQNLNLWLGVKWSERAGGRASVAN